MVFLQEAVSFSLSDFPEIAALGSHLVWKKIELSSDEVQKLSPIHPVEDSDELNSVALERKGLQLVVGPGLSMLSAGEIFAAPAIAGYLVDMAIVGSRGADFDGQLNPIELTEEIDATHALEVALEFPWCSGELFEQLLPVKIGLRNLPRNSIRELEPIFYAVLCEHVVFESIRAIESLEHIGMAPDLLLHIIPLEVMLYAIGIKIVFPAKLPGLLRMSQGASTGLATGRSFFAEPRQIYRKELTAVLTAALMVLGAVNSIEMAGDKAFPAFSTVLRSEGLSR